MALIGGNGRRRAKAADTQSSATPAVELPPPDLRSELLNLELRFGREALIAEFKRLTAKPRGPGKLLDDWRLLLPHIAGDPIALLEGRGSPLRPTDYWIAKRVASSQPAKLREPANRRLRRKLKETRAERALLGVIGQGRSGYPAADYVAALRWNPGRYEVSGPLRDLIDSFAREAEATIARYRDRLGEPPAGMTLQEIEAALKAWVPPPPKLSDHIPDMKSPLGVLVAMAERAPKT
jgi:hypothetical protein